MTSSDRSTSAPPRRTSRGVAALLLVAICTTQSLLTWTWVDRNGFFERPLTSDAGWYRIDALKIKRAAESGGVFGYFKAGYEHERSHPPLVIMVAAAVALALGDDGISVEAALLAIQLFGVLHVVGAYRLARLFLSRGGAVGAAALSAFSLGAIAQLRPLYPQFPMTALVLWAYDGIARSDGFRRLRPSLVAGAFIGLATLAKMLAPLYVVGAALAALVFGLLRREDVGVRVRNAVFCAGLGALVAALWFGAHFETTLAYFTRVTGEGGQEFFSRALPAASFGRWAYYAWHFLDGGVGWFAAPVYVAGIVAGSALALRRSTDDDGRRRARAAAILAAAPLVAYAPLTLGQTAAGAFYLGPFAPLAAIAAVRFVATRRTKIARVALAAWLALASAAYVVLSQRAAGSPPTGPVESAPLERDDAVLCPFLPALPGATFEDGGSALLVHLVPRVDSVFGSYLGFVRGRGAKPAETWPVDEFLDVVGRSTRASPVVFVGTPLEYPHPYAGHAHFKYEADRRGLPIRFHSIESLLGTGADPIAVAASSDFLVVDERPYPGSMPAERVVQELRAVGVEGEMLMRRTPTSAGSLALVELRRAGSADGPRPASDLDLPGVRRADVLFENGWRLLGYRAETDGVGRPFVVLWFDGLAERERDVAIRVTRIPKEGKLASVLVDSKRLGSADAARPLLAATFHGFRTTDAPEDGAYGVRVTTAKQGAPEGHAAAVRSDLRLRGRFSPTFPHGASQDAAASRTTTRKAK
jgi:hypothetical protein